MKQLNQDKFNAGFTLIEMSIVLVILSVVIGSGISIALVQLENARIESTKKNQQAAKTAILNFISRNNRMPCPAIATLPSTDARYGVEAVNPGTCTGTTRFGAAAVRNVRGILPWKSLGLTDHASVDGYERRMTYQVFVSQTALNQTTISGLRGNIIVWDSAAPGAQNQLNPGFPAVATIISHGKNGRGAYLPISGRRMGLPRAADIDERENVDNDVNFVDKEYSDLNVNPFDDIVMWIEPVGAISTLNQQGDVPSPNSVLNTLFTTIQNTLLGYVIADNLDPDGAGVQRTVSRRLPYADNRGNPNGNAVNGALNGVVPWVTIGLTQANVTDPWGNLIRYTNVEATLPAVGTGGGMTKNDPAAGNTAYVISSDGADGVQGNQDDQSITVQVGTLRGILVNVNMDDDQI